VAVRRPGRFGQDGERRTAPAGRIVDRNLELDSGEGATISVMRMELEEILAPQVLGHRHVAPGQGRESAGDFPSGRRGDHQPRDHGGQQGPAQPGLPDQVPHAAGNPRSPTHGAPP
jgi:hypothetical protein